MTLRELLGGGRGGVSLHRSLQQREGCLNIRSILRDGINKLCTSDTRVCELTASSNPDGINKLCTSDARERELTGECHPEEINKLCTSDTPESELTAE